MATRANSITDQALSDRLDTVETGVNDITLNDNGDGTYTFNNPTSGQTTGVSLVVDNLQDVVLTSVQNGETLVYNTGNWVNHTTATGQIAYPSENIVPENNGVDIATNAEFKLGANVTTPIAYISSESTGHFTVPVAGRLTYTGNTVRCIFTICGSLSISDNDRAFEMYLKSANGTVIVTNSRCLATSKNAVSKGDDFSKTWLLTVNTGDNFEVWGKCLDSTTVTFREICLSVVEVS